MFAPIRIFLDNAKAAEYPPSFWIFVGHKHNLVRAELYEKGRSCASGFTPQNAIVGNGVQ